MGALRLRLREPCRLHRVCQVAGQSHTFPLLSRSLHGTASLTSSSQYSTALVTSSSTSSVAGTSTPALTTSEPSPSATASSSPPQSAASGLPIGAKIAIGAVCGVVGLTLILLGMFCLLRKRKRSKASSEPHLVHTEAEKTTTPEAYNGPPGEHVAEMSELDNTPVKRSMPELP
jgi:hypothetical protein